jgi:hypothetical protein
MTAVAKVPYVLNKVTPDASGTYVYFAANATFRKALHTHCKGMKYSSTIGATHVSESDAA